jgi:hypothetical protein
VSVFFDKIPTLPKMMHKPTFLANLQLPPSHPKFPVSVVLVWPVPRFSSKPIDRSAPISFFPNVRL